MSRVYKTTVLPAILLPFLALCLPAQSVWPPPASGGGGSGTVTSVATGTGLTGGPITGSGTVSCLNATTSVLGCIKPDGTTVTISSGTISAIGTPGGTSGQVQWNNGSGAFGGDSGLAYNSGTNSLGVIGTIVSGQNGTAQGKLTLNGATSGSADLSVTSTLGTLNLGSTNATVTSAGAITATGFTGNLTGTATTATNLATYPTLCSGGQFSTGFTTGSPPTNNCDTPAGGGNVSNTGTPVQHQVAIWNSATVVKGLSTATVDDSGNAAFNSVAAPGGISAGSSPPSSSVCTAGTAGMDCLLEGTTPTGTLSAVGVLWSKSSDHRLHMINAGVDTTVTGASDLGTLAGLSTLPLTDMAAQAADTVVMNATGGSAAPTAVAMPTCTSGAVLYNTSTHAWTCVSAGSASWSIGAAWDGGGLALVGTLTECTVAPYSGTITGAWVTGDVSGSATITATTVALASYTGISGVPYATAIPATTNLNISTALSAAPAVAGWTSLTAGYMVCFQASSISGFTHLEVKLAY